MIASPEDGSSYASAAVIISTFFVVPNLGSYPVTFTVLSNLSTTLPCLPFTHVSVWLSSSVGCSVMSSLTLDIPKVWMPASSADQSRPPWRVPALLRAEFVLLLPWYGVSLASSSSRYSSVSVSCAICSFISLTSDVTDETCLSRP